MNCNECSRRDFLIKGSAATVTIAAAATGIVNCLQPVTGTETYTFDITNAEYAALATIGGSVYCVMNDSNFPAIVTRTGQNELKAYSSKCTHQGCKINLPVGATAALCPCHDSLFNSSGNVIEGPASNQPTYSVTISGNIVTITG
jgi:Rieske Fe-S protein